MQVRLMAFLLLSSCSFPGADLTDRERMELAARAVVRDGEGTAAARSCSRYSCYDYRAQQSGLHVQNVGISTGKSEHPEQSEQPSLEVDLPVSVLDCSMVGLTVVGPWQAKLGESIELNVLVRGLDETEEQPTLSWETSAGELTELGPLSAEVQCSVLGMHALSVALAAPAPCPSHIEVAIECDAAAVE